MIGLVNAGAPELIAAAIITAAGLLGGGMTLGRRFERRRNGNGGRSRDDLCPLHKRVQASVHDHEKRIAKQETATAVITTEIGGLTKLFEDRFDGQAGAIRAITESVKAVHERLDRLIAGPS